MPCYKRITGKYFWIPPEKRPGRIPGPPPGGRKPESKKPIYLLKRDRDELFFVNLSGETLNRVSTVSDSLLRYTDEGDYMETGGAKTRYDYVEPQEAVKIDSYDQFLDPETIIFLNIIVSKSDSNELLFRIGGRGGVHKDTVLLWDNGDLGRKVKLITNKVP